MLGTFRPESYEICDMVPTSGEGGQTEEIFEENYNQIVECCVFVLVVPKNNCKNTRNAFIA